MEKETEQFKSITSSTLLDKHNANIARLAESFGINIQAENKLPETKISDPKFEKDEFKSKLAGMVSNPLESIKEEKNPLEDFKKEELPQTEKTFMNGNDVFSKIKDKYLRDSHQYMSS